MKTKLFTFLLIIVFALPSVSSLLQPGFFQSDDGEWMIIRFSAFHQALEDGQFPVRFLGRLNYGYGYPVANFLYPGFMYLAEPIHLLGFGFTDAIKILLGISMVGSALFTFFWLSKLFNTWAAVIGSLFYLYTPYHLFDLYKRGSVGEVLALFFVPFILWMIERKNLFFTSVGIFFLILSHNTMALLFLPILFLYGVLRKKISIKSFSFSLLLGILLSSFFAIPAVFELSNTQFARVAVSNPSEYFASLKLIGGSSLAILLVSCMLFLYAIRVRKKKNVSGRLLFLFAAIGFASVILGSSVSTMVWNSIPSSFIQFPFRFLSLLVLSVSFLAAFCTSLFKRYDRMLVSYVFFLILSVSAFSFLTPAQFFDKGDAYYATNEATTNVQDEYMPLWVRQKPTGHYKQKVELVSGSGEIKNLSFDNRKVSFKIETKDVANVRINTIYYLGWKAYVDGQEVHVDYSNPKGVMDLQLAKGAKEVQLIFSETLLRLFADFMSVSAAIVLSLLAFATKRNSGMAQK